MYVNFACYVGNSELKRFDYTYVALMNDCHHILLFISGEEVYFSAFSFIFFKFAIPVSTAFLKH